MLQVTLVVLAAGVALVYFTIAALVVPKIGLENASRRFVFLVRAGAVLFFVGCGLTHIHLAVHYASQPVAVHELGFHVLQFVGGWVFVIAALRYLDIRIEQRDRDEVHELKQLALRDPLTGAYNRRFLDEALAKELDRQRRYGAPVCVVHLDVDDFKHVNDRWGHGVGDELLREIVNSSRSMVRPSDSIIRLGGDEFVLLLPESERLQGLAVAERLRARMASFWAEQNRGVTISAGIAASPEDTIDPVELMEMADRALYWAKQHGKNRCALAEAPALDTAG
jgi:diguanylate cyclase (GGDEF)-like protein